MQNFYRAALTLSVLSLLTGCVIGRVLYGDLTPYSGANLTVKLCETCTAYPVTTDADGYWGYDPYTNPTLPQFAEADDGIIITLEAKEWRSGNTCYRTGEIQQAHRTIYSTGSHPITGQSVWYTVVPVIMTERVSVNVSPSQTCASADSSLDAQQFARDYDNDGLTVSVEQLAQTFDANVDSDRDGLSDSLEWYGMIAGGLPHSRTWTAASDIRSRGATPTRKDSFIEVDYWSDAVWTMEPSPELENMIAAHYDGLDTIVNPDGSTGMDVVLFKDQSAGTLLNGCSIAQYAGDGWAFLRGARRDGVFTHGVFCPGPNNAGGIGGNGVGATFMIAGATDRDATNNMTEPRQNTVFSSFIHEYGHTLSLTHGGVPFDKNCKPNYPSDMNYAYFPAFRINGVFPALAWTESRYSNGSLLPLVESSLTEIDPLNAWWGTVDFLNRFGGFSATAYGTWFSSNGNTDVDWNRSGGITSGTFSQNLRVGGDPGGSCDVDEEILLVLYDRNDAFPIIDGLDDPRRLTSHTGAGFGGLAGGNEECGVLELTGEPGAPLSARISPWMDPRVVSRLERMTGLSGDKLDLWIRQAGFDPEDPVDTLQVEKLLGMLAHGDSAKHTLSRLGEFDESSIAWISRSDAERELIQRATPILEKALGRPVKVSFDTCPLKPEISQEPRNAPRGRGTNSETFDVVDHIQLCR